MLTCTHSFFSFRYVKFIYISILFLQVLAIFIFFYPSSVLNITMRLLLLHLVKPSTPSMKQKRKRPFGATFSFLILFYCSGNFNCNFATYSTRLLQNLQELPSILFPHWHKCHCDIGLAHLLLLFCSKPSCHCWHYNAKLHPTHCSSPPSSFPAQLLSAYKWTILRAFFFF